MTTNPLVILAIETSCDETALAVVRKHQNTIEVLASAVASQVDIHALTGGVVPEVAAREHVTVLRPLLQRVIEKSNFQPQDFSGIAVTVGPGLPPALAVGVTAARTLSFAWRKPVIPVHHIEGHIYSALLPVVSNTRNENTAFHIPASKEIFPALALIVSGGHTLLIHIADHLRYTVLGSTRDDAAGEAFDKAARMLGLSYPGGPALSRLAQQGNPAAYDFPRPMTKEDNLDFSFSGLKTALYYTIRNLSEEKLATVKADLAASFEQAIVDTLLRKVSVALSRTPARLLVLAGGVAANHKLRTRVTELASQHALHLRIAPLSLCGDNAIMIGLVGTFAHTVGRLQTWEHVDFHTRMSITALEKR